MIAKQTLSALCVALMMSVGTMAVATAQTPQTAPAAKTTPTSKAEKPAKPERTAKSKECSAQADAKGLHGKERKKFRSKCKKS